MARFGRYIIRTRVRLLDHHQYETMARARIEARKWSTALNVRVYVTDLDGFVRHAFVRGEEVDFAHNYQLKSGYTGGRRHLPKARYAYTPLPEDETVPSSRPTCSRCHYNKALAGSTLCAPCAKHMKHVQELKKTMGDPTNIEPHIVAYLRRLYHPREVEVRSIIHLGANVYRVNFRVGGRGNSWQSRELLGSTAMKKSLLSNDPPRKKLYGIAKRRGLSRKDFNPRQLARGTKVEMEHTRSKRVAETIAMDHLAEDPMYYVKLARCVENDPRLKRLTKAQKAFVSKKISILRHEGYPPKQAVAIAYNMARRGV